MVIPKIGSKKQLILALLIVFIGSILKLYLHSPNMIVCP
ncbi:putative membrane protein [Synechococcus sp. A15-127]|nr:putative membrane protein [Synechococcus sp. A15-127]